MTAPASLQLDRPKLSLLILAPLLGFADGLRGGSSSPLVPAADEAAVPPSAEGGASSSSREGVSMLEASSEFPINQRILAPLLAASATRRAPSWAPPFTMGARLDIAPAPASPVAPLHADQFGLEIGASSPAWTSGPSEERWSSTAGHLSQVQGTYRSGSHFVISVPTPWKDKLLPRTLSSHRPSLGEKPVLFSAKLADLPDFDVAFKVLSLDVAENRREHALIPLVSDAPHVVTYFETQVFPDSAYMLMESHASTLEQRLEELWEPEPAENRKTSSPRMSLDNFLPIAVDILRGVESLEQHGITAPYLSEDTIFFDGAGRAFLGGLGKTCLAAARKNTMPELTCQAFFDPQVVYGNAMRHAPEMELGIPTSIANTMWDIGLLFSKMLLGVVPTEDNVLKTMSDPTNFDSIGTNPTKVDQLRLHVAQVFDLQTDPHFDALGSRHDEVKELLAGLLTKNPRHRWSATGALRFALDLAEKHGVEIRPPRSKPSLPDEWFDMWQ